MPTQNALLNTRLSLTIAFHTFILIYVAIKYPKSSVYHPGMIYWALKRIQVNLTYFLAHPLMSSFNIFRNLYVWHKQIRKSLNEISWEECIWFVFWSWYLMFSVPNLFFTLWDHLYHIAESIVFLCHFFKKECNEKKKKVNWNFKKPFKVGKMKLHFF